MNGVRNFLRAATATTPPSSAHPDSQSPPQSQSSLSQTAPLSFVNVKPPGGPSWPSPSSTQAQTPTKNQSPKTTAALSLKKDPSRHKPQPPPPSDDLGAGNSSFRSSTSTSASTSMSLMSPSRRSQTSSPPTNSRISALNGRTSPGSTSSSPRVRSSNPVTRKSVAHPESAWKRSSGPLNTRDELLISLLASQAVVDSRDFEILGSEEVDELKKARPRASTSQISDYFTTTGAPSANLPPRSYVQKARPRDQNPRCCHLPHQSQCRPQEGLQAI